MYDLGAGDFTLSAEMLALGAAEVTAVDRHVPDYVPVPPGVRRVTAYFHDWVGRAPERLGVVLLSWPANWRMEGLIELIERTDRVIYLGKNTDGTACGWRELFEALRRRPVLDHVPDPANDLLIYGPGDVDREPFPEERAALSPFAEAWNSVHASAP